MSSDLNFTVTSWFLGNVRVKPYFNTRWGGKGGLKSLNICLRNIWMVLKMKCSKWLRSSIVTGSNAKASEKTGAAFWRVFCPKLFGISPTLLSCSSDVTTNFKTSNLLRSCNFQEFLIIFLKVSKSWKQLMVFSILPKNKQSSLPWAYLLKRRCSG